MAESPTEEFEEFEEPDVPLPKCPVCGGSGLSIEGWDCDFCNGVGELEF
jgi:hypothetical protein